MATISIPTRDILGEDLLERIADRAPEYDRTGRFFTEDLDELRASGYLLAAVPERLGGAGLDLAQVMRLQERLGHAAPATAIAVNMHLYWTGVAADLLAAGDPSCAWILERAADGAVFAAGHGEAGNDVPIYLSTTRADPVEGGWRLTGRKMFGSLSPAWDFLGLHAMDVSDPDLPMIVHGFLPRDAEGYRIEETWDALGMRATASHDTVLDGAVLPADLVVRFCPAGPGGADMFHLTMLAWALLGFAHVYAGLARRAFELSVESAHRRTSLAVSRTMAHHPETQRRIAEMRMDLDTIEALLDRVTADWVSGAPHGADWPVRIAGAKHVAIARAWNVVDNAMELAGGSAMLRRFPMERLFRDARLGRIHPMSSALTHEVIGKTALGIDLAETPRWG